MQSVLPFFLQHSPSGEDGSQHVVGDICQAEVAAVAFPRQSLMFKFGFKRTEGQCTTGISARLNPTVPTASAQQRFARAEMPWHIAAGVLEDTQKSAVFRRARPGGNTTEWLPRELISPSFFLSLAGGEREKKRGGKNYAS